MPPFFQLLVIDDDPLVIQSVKVSAPTSWRVTGTPSPQRIPQNHFHAIFVDMHFKENGPEDPLGLQLIQKLSTKNPQTEIIAISGDQKRDVMEKALRAGASRFLSKPLFPQEIKLYLEKIEALWKLQNDSSSQNQDKEGFYWMGDGPISQTIKKQIAQLKGEKKHILIEGESGTGKEIAAQILHQQEERGPFVTVNAAAIPENIFESELFGHVRGAFTGAEHNKVGLAEAAHQGDLFLDEIEALPLQLQAKLLRFLESGEIRKVGSQKSVQVKVRVIAATNKNLEQMVQQGQFREDLLWRIGGLRLLLPPLRERTEDIATLANSFLKVDPFRKKELTDEALEVMESHPWPGNVRELKRVCEQLVLEAPLPIIRREDLTPLTHSSSPSPSPHGGTQSIDFQKGLLDLTHRFESKVIHQCLDFYKDINDAARALKISRSSLYKKIKDHNISWRS